MLKESVANGEVYEIFHSLIHVYIYCIWPQRNWYIILPCHVLELQFKTLLHDELHHRCAATWSKVEGD